LAEIKDATEIALFGPAGMKIELEKIIQDDAVLASRIKAVETADSMTDNQMAASVKNHYHHKK